jgi:L-serine dehydratase
MKLEAYSDSGELLGNKVVYSVGGGAIVFEENWGKPEISVYSLTTMDKILAWHRKTGGTLPELVIEAEESDTLNYLEQVWNTMKSSIERGLDNEGLLPGTLGLQRKASSYFMKANNAVSILKNIGLISAYALAVSEENAAGGKVVTAPTCGASGVLPAVLYFMQKTYNLSKQKILRGLATAGLIGNLVKENASISGAEVGCQGEVGTACAMAAAAATQLLGGTVTQIEYAAEMGIEHHLGLTCDPVEGYVQIPCIERNAIAAGRALQCASYAMLSDGIHRISFDEVVQTMKETGLDMGSCYKETSRCGLAKNWLNSENKIEC